MRFAVQIRQGLRRPLNGKAVGQVLRSRSVAWQMPLIAMSLGACLGLGVRVYVDLCEMMVPVWPSSASVMR